MAMKFIAVLTSVLLLPCYAGDHPVGSVIKLLQDLQGKVVKEAKEEQATFEKFSAWCDEMSDVLGKTVTEEIENIDTLGDTVSGKTKEKADVDENIASLQTEIQKFEAEELTESGNRDAAHALWVETDKNLKETIAAVDEALTSLKESKGAFLQTFTTPTPLQTRALEKLMATPLVLAQLSDDQREALTGALGQQDTEADVTAKHTKKLGAYRTGLSAYHFKAGSVLDLLEGLKTQFQDQKAEATNAETYAAWAYGQAKDSRATAGKAASTAKDSKSGSLGEVISDLATATSDLSDEKDEKKADSTTLDDTKRTCTLKKSEFSQRTELRRLEIEAMKAAIGIMAKVSGVRVTAPEGDMAAAMSMKADESKVAGGCDLSKVQHSCLFAVHHDRSCEPTPSWPGDCDGGSDMQACAQSVCDGAIGCDDVNGKFECKAQATKLLQKAPATPGAKKLSLLQVDDPKMKAMNLIRKEATQTHSKELSQFADQLATKLDGPFDSVNNMVQKMIFRLMAEQTDEDAHKLWCDKEASTSETSKKTKGAKVESLDIKINSAKATSDELVLKIKELTDKASKLGQFIATAGQVRQESKKENKLAIKDAQEAQAAIAKAEAVLTAFYKDSGMITKEPWEFLQVPEPVTLPEEPSSWDSSYTGVADPTTANTGVIAVLQATAADFAKMEADTRAQEITDQSQYDRDMKESSSDKVKASTEANMKSIENKRALEKANSMTKLKKHSEHELYTVEQYIKDLEPSCVTGDTSYADRKTARDSEIKALKEAQVILKDAMTESKLLQTVSHHA